MAKLLMSINPQYVKEILLGNKKYEFRKRLSYKTCSKIIIYSTSPDKKIVGEVNVIETLEMTPSILWEKTKEEAGISADKFKEYFKDSEKAYAYKLGDVIVYGNPIELINLGIKYPPQSFMYLSEEQYKNMF